MKKLLILLAASVLIIFSGCDKEDIPELDNLSSKTKALIDSDNVFGFDLFQRVLVDAEPDENLCLSPLSISLALAMTYNGASGDTQIAMEETLKLAGFTRDEINGLYRDLTQALLSDDPKVQMEIANSIWYRDSYTILDDFVLRNETYYDALVKSLDFTDPGSKDVINGWVSDKTHEKIESIVDQISPESFMFLINAIYFKGTWKYEFDEEETLDLPFYLEDGTTEQVPSMKQEADLNMLKTEVFNAVELPYGKGNWAMYVMVPNGSHQLGEITSTLDNDAWKGYLVEFQEVKDVKLQLPKWKSEYETSLKPVLTDMGMSVAFSSAADFSDIAPGLPLSISDVKHKTFIEVNEEGTEAAAVTSVEINLTSIGGDYFSANRPFVYLIAEKTTGAILFAGRVLDPSK